MRKALIDLLANRDLTAVVQLAEQHVRERLSHRAPASIEEVLGSCDLLSEVLPGSRIILSRLGEALEIDPGRLRPDDRFGDLFRVAYQELGSDAAGVLKRHRVTDPVEVFGFDILHVVEAVSSADRWEAQRSALEHPPKNETEWLDAIMRMKLREFLRFFGATVSSKWAAKSSSTDL